MKHDEFTILGSILSSDYVIMLRESAGAAGNSRALVSVFLADLLASIGTDDIAWVALNKTGSDLADLATKSHTDLTDIGTMTHAQLESALAANDGTKIVNLAPFPNDIDVEIRDGSVGFAVPAAMNALELTAALATVYTPGTTSGTTNINLRRARGGVETMMLSTPITIGPTEYYAADGVIDLSNDDLNTGDMIFVDVLALTSVPPQGLSVVLTFS